MEKLRVEPILPNTDRTVTTVPVRKAASKQEIPRRLRAKKRRVFRPTLSDSLANKQPGISANESKMKETKMSLDKFLALKVIP